MPYQLLYPSGISDAGVHGSQSILKPPNRYYRIVRAPLASKLTASWPVIRTTHREYILIGWALQARMRIGACESAGVHIHMLTSKFKGQMSGGADDLKWDQSETSKQDTGQTAVDLFLKGLQVLQHQVPCS